MLTSGLASEGSASSLPGGHTGAARRRRNAPRPDHAEHDYQRSNPPAPTKPDRCVHPHNTGPPRVGRSRTSRCTSTPQHDLLTQPHRHCCEMKLRPIRRPVRHPGRMATDAEDLVQIAERALADAEEAYRLDPSETNQRRAMKAWASVRAARERAREEKRREAVRAPYDPLAALLQTRSAVLADVDRDPAADERLLVRSDLTG